MECASPIKRFRLNCHDNTISDLDAVKWLTAAVERGREYLVVHLSNMLNLNCTLSGFSFGNVVVLKLKNVRVDIFSSVVFFPSLRIIWMMIESAACQMTFSVTFSHFSQLKMLLSQPSERKLEHLEIQMCDPHHMLCGIFSIRNLVVLKLTGFFISTFSHVDFPSLKTLHLNNVEFGHRWFIFELLNGCPILEDFEAYYITMGNLSTSPDQVLKCLPKLVRAYIFKTSNFPLQPFCSIQSLYFEEVKGCNDLLPTFNNLTQLGLALDYNWQFLVKVLNHCPKLQKLDLDKLSTCKRSWREKDVKENWVDPNFVPQCLSIHLKTCNLRNFLGRLKGELLLASVKRWELVEILNDIKAVDIFKCSFHIGGICLCGNAEQGVDGLLLMKQFWSH
ncbi:hypothetical protein QL285_085503 [Trifolium repens]|nr:hypothetical protein QL285_085503 [Trifolium repens]